MPAPSAKHGPRVGRYPQNVPRANGACANRPFYGQVDYHIRDPRSSVTDPLLKRVVNYSGPITVPAG
jgi:hypothetical protein